MNNYEKLGKIIVCGIIAFLVAFSFSAIGMVFINLFGLLSGIETFQVCCMVGIVFGIFGARAVYEWKFN